MLSSAGGLLGGITICAILCCIVSGRLQRVLEQQVATGRHGSQLLEQLWQAQKVGVQGGDLLQGQWRPALAHFEA